MARCLVALLLLAALGGCADAPPAPTPPVADPESLRRTPSGAVLGKLGRYGNHEWLGLPYAEPPVAELRWRSPQPAPAWADTREALRFGAICTQFASRLGGAADAEPGSVVGQEDCLTLNVYAPRLAPPELPTGDDLLPVMVWIHGGGNTIGSASFYDGGHLAARERVVVVTINYRLGPFGWLRHPSLRAPGSDALERSGNFGTLDQIRALEWVRDHVAAFGGDPERVTVFGESAGGRNVLALLLSPAAEGLFHRAIVQSGSTRLWTPAEAENPADDPREPGHPASSREIVPALYLAQGQAPDAEQARRRVDALPPEAVAAWLRGLDAGAVLEAYRAGEGTGMIAMPTLFADGRVLPQGDPLLRFSRPDAWNRMPVMLGTNRDEDRLFMALDPAFSELWFDLLPRLRDEERFLVNAEYRSRLWKAQGADEPARAMRLVEPRVFVYRFDWDEEPNLLLTDFGTVLGAAHGFEIPFVFGHFELGDMGRFFFTRGNRDGRQALSAAMMGYWARFAADGDPGRGGQADGVAWTAWDDSSPEAPKFLVLDTPEGSGIAMSSQAEESRALVAEVERDPRLPERRDKCEVLRHFALHRNAITREAYAASDGTACASYPLEEYPWERAS